MMGRVTLFRITMQQFQIHGVSRVGVMLVDEILQLIGTLSGVGNIDGVVGLEERNKVLM